jgi:hypothetical protein
MNRRASNSLTPDSLREIFPAFARMDSDVRFRMLSQLFAVVQQDRFEARLEALSTERLVAYLIDTIKRCQFAADDFEAFKTQCLDDAWPVFRQYAKCVLGVLSKSGVKEDHPVNILSIGSGNGHIEQFLHMVFLESLPSSPKPPQIRWIGLAITPAASNSFFHDTGNRFAEIDENSALPYLALARHALNDEFTERNILIANFAYHHLGIGIFEFLQRCAGVDRVVLLEEPTTRAEWACCTYRMARIGCDLLANVGFNPSWAQRFLEEPNFFKVRYLLREEVAQFGGTIVDLEGCSPQMSIVLF